MKVAVIVVNFNGMHETLLCLRSLANLDLDKGVNVYTVVVDNVSVDESVHKIKKQFPGVSLIQNKTNIGFSEGNNVGIKHALTMNPDFILLLNNDTTVSTNFISELIKAAQLEKKGGIFGPKIYFSHGFETHKSKYKSRDLGKVIWYAGGKMDWNNVLASHRGVDEVDKGQYEQMVKTTFVSGCAMFIRREVFETVGFLDEKLYLYYEDVDYCQRVRNKGFELYYVPKALMWHNNAASAEGTGSELQSYYITRNRMLIGMRYASWRTRLALFREAVRLLMNGTRTQKSAIGDFLRKKYGPRGGSPWVLPQINLFNFFEKKKHR